MAQAQAHPVESRGVRGDAAVRHKTRDVILRYDVAATEDLSDALAAAGHVGSG